eukprot:TRINITY_DN3459_c0_g1_i13.p1 TRINITY_DN3459_c0_g1~~TRINITY_DN3459_c0_g1_i13.p1  ORF type:complete len:475 (-),score=66.91 TRINITY_DN3459_c0_g1_i13:395-1819(-)
MYSPGVLGVCSSQPLVVFMPEFSYKDIARLIRGYYGEKMNLSKEESEQFLSNVRSFNTNIGIYNGKCRICCQPINDDDILDHVLQHIKKSASEDMSKACRYPDDARCSFTTNCSIEHDRVTMTQGFFNNKSCKNHTDFMELIKEHYRRHLRDEIAHLRSTFGGALAIPDEHYLYNMAEISIDVENEQGGLSSSSEDEDTHSNVDAMEIDKTDHQELRQPGSSQRRRSNSSASERDTNGGGEKKSYKCKSCNQTLTTHTVLKKHLIHKHLYKEFKQWLYDNIQVDVSGKCGVESCKQKDKQFTFKSYVVHMGTVHNLIEKHLESNDRCVMDYFEKLTDRSRVDDIPSSESEDDCVKKGGVGKGNRSNRITSDESSEVEDDDSTFDMFKKRLNPIEPGTEKSPPQENREYREQREDQNAPKMQEEREKNANRSSSSSSSKSSNSSSSSSSSSDSDSDTDSQSSKSTVPAEQMETDP